LKNFLIKRKAVDLLWAGRDRQTTVVTWYQFKMLLLQYKDLTIELTDDATFTFGSADNTFTYLKHYFGDGAHEYQGSSHAIRIYENDTEINSCIVIATGGATGIHSTSAVIDNDRLLICCRDTVFCLTIPELDLAWKTRADEATCFQVFTLQDDYLIHGELEITRLSKDGQIIWRFGGADIFVNFNGSNEVQIFNDHLLLTDWNNTQYKLDFEGKLISSTFK